MNVKDIKPEDFDPSMAFQALKNIQDSLQSIIPPVQQAANNKAFDGFTIEKTYPVFFKGTKHDLKVMKDKTMVLKIEGITDDEIKQLVKKLNEQ